MNNALTYILTFASGAAIGSVITWKIVKEKYEQISREEIDSVIKKFSKKDEDDKQKEADINEYERTLNENKYVSDSEIVEDVEKPYIITPDEFGEFEEYETESLVYFSDGYLTDDAFELIDDVDNIVGKDSLNHFREYEDDSVFVRNDRLKTDYEILADLRNYADILNNTHPEDE